MDKGATISHYRIIEKLGEGGMGVVYKARDTKLDRDVALKFLPQSLTPTEEDRRRFIREAKSAAALNHPNICTIYSVDEYEDRQFISMEYIDGETLRTKIDDGDLNLELALNYAMRIADALGKAHQHDIIHRDIKPENIMLDEDGRIKVMDFGLAKLKQARDITKTGDTVGTLAYMSPEQIRGQQVDHRSDLFSLGILLYEMLTGRKPFQGEHQAAMTYSIVNEEPAPLNTYLPDTPEGLIKIIDRLLAKDSEDRSENASQVLNSLENVKKSADGFVQQSTSAETENEANEQDSGSSTTISLTKLSLGFGGKSIGKAGLLVGATALLALVLFAGWWFIGGNGAENNETANRNGNKSKITDRSIAVLPFNALGQKKPDAFTEGIHDDLLTRLSNISDLQVTSRSSVEYYSKTDLTLPKFADSLGVRWVVEGGIRQSGDLVQVNAKLIDPRSDSYVWSDMYRRQLTAKNLFAIQEEITKKIAQSLKAQITEEEENRIARQHTENIEAYRLYAEGRSHWNRHNENGWRTALEYYSEAITADPNYAPAYAGRADALHRLAFFGLMPPHDAYSQAREDINHALKLDSTLANAHITLGKVLYFYDWNWSEAEKEFRRALNLNPSSAEAHHIYSVFMARLGRFDEAQMELSKAIDLNPLSSRMRSNEGWITLLSRDYRTAIQKYQSIVELNPVFEMSHREMSWAYIKVGNYHKAIKHSERAVDLSPSDFNLASLGFVLGTAGEIERAQNILDTLHTKKAEDYVSPTSFALIHTGIGDKDQALNWLEKSAEERSSFLVNLAVHPLFDPLRDNLRFQKLLRQIGLDHLKYGN